jgi:ribA/ribD-fused uncharacterized protein
MARAMAAKARLFGDDHALAAVLGAASPKDAKAVGRAVRGYREQDWAAARFGLVVAGSLAKFRQNPDLADFLRGTGRSVLADASPRDRIWGIAMRAGNPDAGRPELDGPGESACCGLCRAPERSCVSEFYVLQIAHGVSRSA